MTSVAAKRYVGNVVISFVMLMSVNVIKQGLSSFLPNKRRLSFSPNKQRLSSFSPSFVELQL